ncbi:MAG: lipid-A-disaccharide synthase [Deltaproteobacteria bacterium RIFCSPHIGHO2_12_FULL_43_9]|nr:MAG: lipid-A-disaccharide synthase [Deltaproteobacteria bacterium RIFCSPHIGHO2_12_FULL_43_9]
MSGLLIVAGEASADHHGATVVEALRLKGFSPKVWGVGGDALVAQGADLVATSKEMAVMGLFEGLSKWPLIFRAFKEIVRRVKKNRPDVALLIDYPGFNIRLAKVLKKLKIPVVYYISPQIWAWKPGRIHTLKECISEMLVIFQFEEKIYMDANIPVKFVGHPILERKSRNNETSIEGLLTDRPIVTLMPGSRISEIRRLMPPIVDAAKRIFAKRPDVQFGLPLAPTIDRPFVESYLADLPFRVVMVENNRDALIKISDAAIVCSGTATLDVGIAAVPMVVIYKGSPITVFIGRRFIHRQLFGMTNVLMRREVVPEFFQEEISGERIADVILKYITDEKYASEIKKELGEIKRLLGEPGASGRVAERLVPYLTGEITDRHSDEITDRHSGPVPRHCEEGREGDPSLRSGQAPQSLLSSP